MRRDTSEHLSTKILLCSCRLVHISTCVAATDHLCVQPRLLEFAEGGWKTGGRTEQELRAGLDANDTRNWVYLVGILPDCFFIAGARTSGDYCLFSSYSSRVTFTTMLDPTAVLFVLARILPTSTSPLFISGKLAGIPNWKSEETLWLFAEAS